MVSSVSCGMVPGPGCPCVVQQKRDKTGVPVMWTTAHARVQLMDTPALLCIYMLSSLTGWLVLPQLFPPTFQVRWTRHTAWQSYGKSAVQFSACWCVGCSSPAGLSQSLQSTGTPNPQLVGPPALWCMYAEFLVSWVVLFSFGSPPVSLICWTRDTAWRLCGESAVQVLVCAAADQACLRVCGMSGNTSRMIRGGFGLQPMPMRRHS